MGKEGKKSNNTGGKRWKDYELDCSERREHRNVHLSTPCNEALLTELERTSTTPRNRTWFDRKRAAHI